jgi:hypothetical protein
MALRIEELKCVVAWPFRLFPRPSFRALSASSERKEELAGRGRKDPSIWAKKNCSVSEYIGLDCQVKRSQEYGVGERRKKAVENSLAQFREELRNFIIVLHLRPLTAQA